MSVRVVVVMSEDEVKKLDHAADRAKLQKPGKRSTRSDVVREGALRYAEEILTAKPDESPKE